MAHLIERYDSMVSKDLEPWHYAETQDQTRIWHGQMTTDQVIEASGLGWKVEEREGLLIPEEGDNWADQATEGYKFLIRNDMATPLLLGCVKNTYQPLQNQEIFDAFDPLVKDGLIEYETAGSLRNCKTVWALARFTDKHAEVVGGGTDAVKKYVVIHTTHDGTGSVNVKPTMIRVVCNNTLQVALRSQDGIKLTHRGNVAGRVSTAADAVVHAGEKMQSMMEYFGAMNNFDMDADEREEYFSALAPDHPRPEKHVKAQNTVLAKRATWEAWRNAPENRNVTGYNPNSLWACYNAVTRMSTHCVSGRVRDRAANQIMGSGAQLSQAALDEALSWINSDQDKVAETALS